MPVTLHDTQWTTYEVHGHTLAEAALQVEHLPEAGQTHWTPSYRATRWQGTSIAAVQVDVHTSVSMPQWVEAATASPAERAEWERFVAALRDHEQGHVDLVHQYLQYADTLLENVTEETAAQQWRDNLAALQSASDQYDTDNDHGRAAGTTIEVPESESESESETEDQ